MVPCEGVCATRTFCQVECHHGRMWSRRVESQFAIKGTHDYW